MKPEMKKLIIANLPYLLFVYLFGKLGQAYRLAEGIDLSQKLLHFADGCAAAFENAAPSFHLFDLLIGVAGAAALRLMVYCKGKNAKKYRKGVEYGSARWGGPKDIAPYIDPNFDNNILLTQTERLTMNNRPKDPKTARNKNVLVIGGSGSGNLLCDRADDKYGGRLPVHVRMILDEFANIGQIPNFDKLIATIRSREISASIILQSQSQLKAIYKDAAEIISDNCDCTLFLSGRGKNAKEISDVLGKETIDSYNQSENRGAQTSHGLNYQKLGKELMSQDEIATMDGGKCILQVRGVRPFFSEKYDITRHPRYKYLSDADKKNYFDVDRYLTALRRKRQRGVSQEETFDLYDIDLSDEDMAAVDE